MKHIQVQQKLKKRFRKLIFFSACRDHTELIKLKYLNTLCVPLLLRFLSLSQCAIRLCTGGEKCTLKLLLALMRKKIFSSRKENRMADSDTMHTKKKPIAAHVY